MAKNPVTVGFMKRSQVPEKIFVDADAFVSVAEKNNSNHKQAIEAAKEMALKEVVAFTSNFAFGEALTVVSQLMGVKLAMKMARDVKAGGYNIIDVTGEQMELALERFSVQASKNTRFTDVVNMVLMDELGIETIFSFDRHYLKGGYKLLGVRQ